jgi:hypothetical protein
MADINFGAITEALNNKVDLPMGDSQDGVDFVVDWQRPTSENGRTWYRKYKSGWVEQGGTLPSGSSSVTLPIAMEDSSYSVQIFYINNNSTSNITFQRVSTDSQSATGFTSPSANSDRRWILCGQSA